MDYLKFYKQEAKRFLKDYNTRVIGEDNEYLYTPQYFLDIKDIVSSFVIDKDVQFKLMQAQHIIAKLAGFRKWNDLIKASSSQLELGRLLLLNREKYQKSIYCDKNIWEDWEQLQKYIKDYNDEEKLEFFKKHIENKLNMKGHKVVLDLTRDIIGQNIVKTNMEKTGLDLEQAIKSSITKEVTQRTILIPWVKDAVQSWPHRELDSEKDGLDNPIITVLLTGEEFSLVKSVRDVYPVNNKNAILYILVMRLESLGYHI